MPRRRQSKRRGTERTEKTTISGSHDNLSASARHTPAFRSQRIERDARTSVRAALGQRVKAPTRNTGAREDPRNSAKRPKSGANEHREGALERPQAPRTNTHEIALEPRRRVRVRNQSSVSMRSVECHADIRCTSERAFRQDSGVLESHAQRSVPCARFVATPMAFSAGTARALARVCGSRGTDHRSALPDRVPRSGSR